MMWIDIVVPNMELVGQYDNLVKPILLRIEKLEEQIEFAKQSRDLMLPRLMRGEEKI